MAEDAEREATTLRLLAMAVDYDARATAADGLSRPQPDDATDVTTKPKVGEPTVDEPTVDEPVVPKAGRKAATGLKKTVTIERRPAGRLS
jgi:hypothetical protein